MSRVMLSANQCSPIEEKLLRALRAFNWDDSWPTQAGFMLEEIGLSTEHTFVFARLIHGVLSAVPSFDLFGPTSQFISRDELNLLAALGNASRNRRVSKQPLPHAVPAALEKLIEACGLALRIGEVTLKSRTIVSAGHSLPEVNAQVLPMMGDTTMRPVKVKSISAPTPLMRRVVVSGEGLFGFTPLLPAQWVKVFLPSKTHHQVGRAFTIRAFDADRHELTFDIALHEGGPMSQWALRAVVGDRLELAGPRGGFKGADPRGWLLLAGDETALPGIAAILETLPEELVTHVFIEIPNAGEKQSLTIGENTYVHWISRQNENGEASETLAEALRYSPLPTRSGDAWIAGEASIIRVLRTRLLRERSFELGRVHAAGYWKQGEQDHCDLAAG